LCFLAVSSRKKRIIDAQKAGPAWFAESLGLASRSTAPGDSLPAAVRPGFPLPRQLLRLGDLRRRHLGGNDLAVPDSVCAALLVGCSVTLAREVEPLVRLDVVLRHAFAAGVQDGEVVLAGGFALVGSLAKPRRRRCWVPRHALTGAIKDAELDLGGGIALVG